MTHPRWKMGDIPDVPDPGATQPPTRVDPDLLRDLSDHPADQSLRPMNLGTPVSPPVREEGSRMLLAAIVVLLVLALGAMFSSSILAGAVLFFA